MYYWNKPRETTCCFTGHRPDKLPSGYRQDAAACQPLREDLRTAIHEAADNGYHTFLSGMALGIDTWAADELLKLRDEGRHIQLVAVLPCTNQDKHWSDKDRHHFRILLSRADNVYTLCEKYTPYCMGARNLWMVERSSLLIAVYDGSSGGTANTIAHAKNFGLHIVSINPKEFVR